MTGYPGAEQIMNGNAFANRDGYKPRYVIIHGTAGGSSAQNIAAYFQSTQGSANPVSAHYVVGQDGAIVQCNREEDGAYANGVLSAGHDGWWDNGPNPNDITISIEHVKPALDNSNALTAAQQVSSFRLIADICNRWGIPKRTADANGGITGHYSIDPVNRSNCPGPYPWDALWNYLSGQTAQTVQEDDMLQLSAVSTWFTGDDTKWTRKDNPNLYIHGDILKFYRSMGSEQALNGMAYLGLPTSLEVKVPGTKQVVEQSFERVDKVRFDPARELDHPPITGTCYLPHVQAAPANVTQLQQQNQQLTADKQALTTKIANAQNALK